MIKKLLLSFLVILLLTGCYHPAEDKEISMDQIEAAFRNNLLDTVLVASPDSVSSAAVINGTICLFHCSEAGRDALLLIDPLTGVTRRFAHFGVGADQMLLAAFSHGGNEAVLRDPTLNKVMRIDVRRAVLDSTYHPQMYRCDFFSQKTIPFGRRLLFLNPYSYKDQAPRVLVSDRKWNRKIHRTYTYWAGNYIVGDLVYNGSDRIAFSSYYVPIIELMNRRGHVRKRLVFQHRTGAMKEVPHHGIIEPINVAPLYFCFTAAAGNSDLFAAAYETDEGENLVLVFDWNGSLLDVFRAGAHVETLSIDSDDSFIYCWEIEGNNGALVRYPYKN